MFKNLYQSLFVSLSFFALALISFLISLWSEVWSSKELTVTLMILGTTHLIFRVIIYNVMVNQLKTGKVRYSLSKTLTLVHLFVASLFIMRVWLPDSTALLAAYGFIAAAVAFSIQDVFKNFIGGITILTRNLYRVGDRVQLGESYGDVIDLGILYTTLLEIRGWVAGDQSTGRIIMVPNATVINTHIKNYTSDHSFIWDEAHIPVTHDSDWQLAESLIREIIEDETDNIATSAREDIYKLQSKYFLTNSNVDPHVFVVITDNWMSLYARYVTDVRTRRITQDRIMRRIKEVIDKEKTITIASQTMSVDTKSKVGK